MNVLFKNNLIVLILHIIIAAIFSTFLFFKGNLFIIWCGSFLVAILYVFTGTKIVSQTSVLKDLLSVSSIAIIGMLLFGLAFTSVYMTIVFYAYNSHVFSLYFIHGHKPDWYDNVIITRIVHLTFTLIPSILLWIGMEWKKRSTRRDTAESPGAGREV